MNSAADPSTDRRVRTTSLAPAKLRFHKRVEDKIHAPVALAQADNKTPGSYDPDGVLLEWVG